MNNQEEVKGETKKIVKKKPDYGSNCLLRLVEFILVLPALVCNIDSDKEAVWYDGIMHGFAFVINGILYMFDNSIYVKAPICTPTYNLFYLIFAIISTLIWVVYLIVAIKRVIKS